jgi:hypothetical protein
MCDPAGSTASRLFRTSAASLTELRPVIDDDHSREAHIDLSGSVVMGMRIKPKRRGRLIDLQDRTPTTATLGRERFFKAQLARGPGARGRCASRAAAHALFDEALPALRLRLHVLRPMAPRRAIRALGRGLGSSARRIDAQRIGSHRRQRSHPQRAEPQAAVAGPIRFICAEKSLNLIAKLPAEPRGIILRNPRSTRSPRLASNGKRTPQSWDALPWC